MWVQREDEKKKKISETRIFLFFFDEIKTTLKGKRKDLQTYSAQSIADSCVRLTDIKSC